MILKTGIKKLKEKAFEFNFMAEMSTLYITSKLCDGSFFVHFLCVCFFGCIVVKTLFAKKMVLDHLSITQSLKRV